MPYLSHLASLFFTLEVYLLTINLTIIAPQSTMIAIADHMYAIGQRKVSLTTSKQFVLVSWRPGNILPFNEKNTLLLYWVCKSIG